MKPNKKKLAKESGLTEYFNNLSMIEQLKYAKKCGTTRRQIQNITWGHSSPGNALAQKLETHGNGVDKVKLVSWGKA